MKKVLICVLVVFTYHTALSQTKPIVMIVPSDNWCKNNGFGTEYTDPYGTTHRGCDYEKALVDDADLLQVISQMNGLMGERGFPLKNLESALKQIKQEAAEEMVMQSRDMGMGVASSPYDKLKETAKADIIMQLTYTMNKVGPQTQVSFNLQGLDAYTDKQVATATGNSPPTMNPFIAELLSTAVLAHIDDFNSTLMSHFTDLFANGREVVVNVKKWAEWYENLESEFSGAGYDDEELSYIIEDWFADNTKGGKFNVTESSTNKMKFEQVRIPMQYEKIGRNGDVSMRNLDTKRFTKWLKDYLEDEFGIISSVGLQGLGKATITLGGKSQ